MTCKCGVEMEVIEISYDSRDNEFGKWCWCSECGTIYFEVTDNKLKGEEFWKVPKSIDGKVLVDKKWFNAANKVLDSMPFGIDEYYE